MTIFLQIIFGFLSGILGGMGMGGGTLLIPLLTIFLQIDQKIAQGINLIVFVFLAIASLIIHTKNKLVKYKDGLPIVLSGGITALVFALLASNISNRTLQTIFGCFLILIGCWQGISIFFRNKK